MINKIFLTFLFLMYGLSFYLVKGQSDCTLLYNYINGDSNDYSNDCCSDPGINCDNGYITKFSNKDAKKLIPDITSFPYLSRIENLTIIDNGIKEISDSIIKLTSLKSLDLDTNSIESIPSTIQNLTNLEILRLNDNNIKELPNELFNFANLKLLNLRGNQIEIIPPAIQNLSQLQELYFEENNIKELPNELFNLPSLIKLNFRENNIEIIPPAIQNLSKLEYLFLKRNNIKQLPKEIFNLKNLKRLTLHDNHNLKTKIINFGSTTLIDCNLNNINVICYQPHTCNKITFNNIEFKDAEAEKELRLCTQEDINNFYRGIEENDNQKRSPFMIIGIILGCIVVILIGILVAFLLIKKRKSKREDNGSDKSSKDEFRTGSIKVTLNQNQNHDNSNNDEKAGVNYENNNDSKKEQKDLSSPLNSTDVNTNRNINRMDNYSGHSTVALPGMVVLLNDPQHPGNYVMSNVALINNTNTDLTNQSHASINIQNLFPSINTDRISNGSHYSLSIDERDEPPPEYSEVN